MCEKILSALESGGLPKKILSAWVLQKGAYFSYYPYSPQRMCSAISDGTCRIEKVMHRDAKFVVVGVVK